MLLGIDTNDSSVQRGAQKQPLYNPRVSQTMRRTSIILVIMILLAGAAPAEDTGESGATGTICLAPVKDDGDPRGYFSGQFGVRIDEGRWVPVPSDTPQPIPDLALEGRHLVSIRDGEKVVESFWFRFDRYHSRTSCLWYKPWYRTWSLWDAEKGGRKCRCQTKNERRAN